MTFRYGTNGSYIHPTLAGTGNKVPTSADPLADTEPIVLTSPLRPASRFHSHLSFGRYKEGRFDP